MGNILINQGTQTTVATDLVGAVNYQIVKLDFGTAGTTNLLGGTSNPLPVVLASGIAGEDLVNNVLVVEPRYSYYHHVGTAGSTSGTIKTSSGFLHSISFNTHTSAGTYALYNSAGTSGSVVGVWAPGASIPAPTILDVTFSNALTFVSGSVCDVTFSYR